MKTLKINEQTHIRLTLLKNICQEKSFDAILNKIMTQATEYQFEYESLTPEEYKLINGDK